MRVRIDHEMKFRIRQVEGFCEHGNESLGAVNCGKHLFCIALFGM
jgi:hypothetical protein